MTDKKKKVITLLVIYIIGVIIIMCGIYLNEKNKEIKNVISQYSLTNEEISIINNGFNENTTYLNDIMNISKKVDFYMVINRINNGNKPIDYRGNIDFTDKEIKKIINSLNINDELVKNFYILQKDFSNYRYN